MGLTGPGWGKGLCSRPPTLTRRRPPPPAFACAAAALLLGWDRAGLIAFSVGALQLGRALPPALRAAVPPIVTSAALTAAACVAAGARRGLSAEAAFLAYRGGPAAAAGILGALRGGPGDIIFSQAAPAVVALGFRWAPPGVLRPPRPP